jgi:glycosyltransferase involved in cell wall biosynthesis
VSSVHRWNDTRIYIKQARSLLQAGYDVTLVAVAAEHAPSGLEGLRIVPLPRRRRAVRWLNWLAILRVVLALRPRIVHAHDPELFPMLVVLRWFGCRVVCDVHEDVAEQILHKEWMARWLRAGLSRAVRVTQRWLPRLVSAVILAEDSYAKNVPAGKNVVIVRNFPLLAPRFKEDYRSDVFRLIYVGDVRIVRGIETYLRITRVLASKHVPVELQVVGSFADRTEEARMHALVDELDLNANVKWHGRRHPQDIPNLLTACDIGLTLLHPIANYRESYPTKMFEYMAAGLPTLASNFELWAAVLDNNHCGRVVDPLDVEAAAAILLEYWGSQELRESHGRNARRAVAERYQWDVEAARLCELYRRLA